MQIKTPRRQFWLRDCEASVVFSAVSRAQGGAYHSTPIEEQTGTTVEIPWMPTALSTPPPPVQRTQVFDIRTHAVWFISGRQILIRAVFAGPFSSEQKDAGVITRQVLLSPPRPAEKREGEYVPMRRESTPTLFLHLSREWQQHSFGPIFQHSLEVKPTLSHPGTPTVF